MDIGFIRVEGLAERINREEKHDKWWIYRLSRRLRLPRAKMDRLRVRYNRFLLHRIDMRGLGDSQQYDSFRRIQLGIRRFNNASKV